MNVDKIMSEPPVTVGMDDTLLKVKSIFENSHFHHLIVVELGKLCGVISDRDLLKAISPNIGTASETALDIKTLGKKVHQVMTRKPIALKENAKVSDAIKIFNKHSISCIPVVDEENNPLGIISWRDIFKTIEKNKGIKF